MGVVERREAGAGTQLVHSNLRTARILAL